MRWHCHGAPKSMVDANTTGLFYMDRLCEDPFKSSPHAIIYIYARLAFFAVTAELGYAVHTAELQAWRKEVHSRNDRERHAAMITCAVQSPANPNLRTNVTLWLSSRQKSPETRYQRGVMNCVENVCCLARGKTPKATHTVQGRRNLCCTTWSELRRQQIFSIVTVIVHMHHRRLFLAAQRVATGVCRQT